MSVGRYNRSSAMYQCAVHWIAFNDEPATNELDDIETFITVAMVADLWSVPASVVAVDVVLARQEGDAP